MSGLGLLSCVTSLLLGGSFAVGGQEDEDTIATVNQDYRGLQSKRYAERQKNPPPAGVQPPLVSDDEILGFIDRCWKVYDRSEGEPDEFLALHQVMVLAAGGAGPKFEEHWREAAGKVFTDFVDDDRMATFVMYIPAPRKLTKEAETLVADLKAKTRNLNIQAAFLYRQLDDDVRIASDAPMSPEKEKELVGRLDDLSKKFGAQTLPGDKTTYADWVATTVYALQNLKVGGLAPEITAADLDGVEFKLSEYRGKVVLLDFWGYW